MKARTAKCCALCLWFSESNAGCNSSVFGTCVNSDVVDEKVWSHQVCGEFELFEELKREFGIKDVE